MSSHARYCDARPVPDGTLRLNNMEHFREHATNLPTAHTSPTSGGANAKPRLNTTSPTAMSQPTGLMSCPAVALRSTRTFTSTSLQHEEQTEHGWPRKCCDWFAWSASHVRVVCANLRLVVGTMGYQVPTVLMNITQNTQCFVHLVLNDIESGHVHIIVTCPPCGRRLPCGAIDPCRMASQSKGADIRRVAMPTQWDPNSGAHIPSAVGNALYDASGRRTRRRGPTRRERTTRRTVSYKASGPDASGMYDASYSVVQGVVRHRHRTTQ